MVTNSQEYIQKLWEIQSGAPRTKALLLPKEEQIFEVDLNTRKISVPEFLSVANDHQAETIYFKIDRYFDNVDLSNKVCIIQYKNAHGDEYVYPVPYCDTTSFAQWNPITHREESSKILIPWCIQGPATAYSGTVEFSIRFVQVGAGDTPGTYKIIYDLNTLVAQGKILEGQNWNITEISDNQIISDDNFLVTLTRLEAIQNSLKVYWLDV